PSFDKSLREIVKFYLFRGFQSSYEDDARCARMVDPQIAGELHGLEGYCASNSRRIQSRREPLIASPRGAPKALF
ncbi:MAG TPA: hypothetical protein VFL79_22470, partial [Terriglobia bacterium]|nr:hypothetical protein [Terriglobia bacterium]